MGKGEGRNQVTETLRTEESRHTLYMIGNAHIDAVWLWRWPEAFQEVKATFQSALDRMNEFDDFVFTCSSVAYYERVERNAPEMFAEIKRRVAEGRWQLVGGWWVEPDCNLPGGEAMVRQGLYGQRYFQEKFGRIATVGYNPDAFGHQATIPQIMAKSGMDAYCFLRPEPHEKSLPGRVFWWEADDGSRILAYRIPHGYCTAGGDLERVIRRVAAEVHEPFNELMCFYGVGNHGGGPTIENIESIHRLDAEGRLPRLVLSGPEAFFDSIRSRDLPIPVVHDELQHHARGCYAAHSGVKRWNRQAEHQLAAAESLATVANVVMELPYPAAALGHGWRNVLFNQFHDILAGSSIEPGYEDARDTYGESLAIAQRALDDAVQAIAWNIDIPRPPELPPGQPAWLGDEQPVVVFNPHAWSGPMPVELEFGSLRRVRGLCDDEGREVPIQVVQSLATVSDSRKRLSFVAELPALGYRLYRVVLEAEAPPIEAKPMHEVVLDEQAAREAAVGADAGSDARAEAVEPPGTHEARVPDLPVDEPIGAAVGDDLVLENDWLRVEIDPESGTIVSLVDRPAELELIAGRAARPAVIRDTSDTWGHGMVALDDEVGEFRPVRVRRLEAGEVRSTIRVEYEWGDSLLRQDFTLYTALPRLVVNVTLDWREQHHALKLRFPVNLFLPRATYEIGYGSIERPTHGNEEPGQRWLDLTGLRNDRRTLHGLAILNDGKYSFDVRGVEAGMTVVRSPIYAHHDPFVPDPDRPYSYLDQGIQRFSYALVPHEGPWERAGLVQLAAELNHPPQPLIETFHAGRLPRSASYAAIDAPNVVLTVLKQVEDEDSDDLVVRAYETTRNATTTTIRLPLIGREWDATFGPAEIKTFRVPRDAGRPIVETNLLEWETS
jgi:alpha-mannosidase